MSITSQLPPISLAQASASLRALAQAAGQTVEAKVLSQAANGTSQVQIGRQVLTLALPEGQVVGSTLTLSVQQSDGQLRLALVAVKPPTASPGAVTTPSVSSAPATSVELSSAALASAAPARPASVGSPGASPTQPSVPAAGSAGVVGSVRSAPSPAYSGASTVSPAQPATPSNAPAPAPVATAQPAVSASGASNPASGLQPAVPIAKTIPQSPGPAAAQPTISAPGLSGAAGATAAPPASVAGQPANPDGESFGQHSVTSQAGSFAPSAPTNSPVQPSAVPRTGIPYPVAAPTVRHPQPNIQAGSAAVGLPPVVGMSEGTTVGQHAPSSTAQPQIQAGAGTTPQAAGPAVQPPVPSTPVTQQAALAQMVQQALPRQDTIVGLTTALTALTGKVALPEPVAKAAQQILAARLSLDGDKPSAAAIKTAIQQSGVFQESLLASGQGQAATGDLKSALMSLRQTLGAWLGNQAAIAQTSKVPPPLKGQVPRAPGGKAGLPDLPDDPIELGKMLLERTDASLSRVRLHQHASLPDSNPARQDAQWSMDLPVIVAGQQQVLHMQIQRDAENTPDRPQERSWQVRFAINLAERGEVGAQISLRAKNTSVLIWADDAETASVLAGEIDGLREELGGIGLVPGAIVVRAGVPASATPQPEKAGGHVVDASR